MAHRRRGFTRSSSKLKNQIWTVVLHDETVLAAAALLTANIVQSSDWTSVDGERATVMTIRGYISIAAQVGVAAQDEGSVMGYIAVQADSAAITAPPDFAATYVNTQMLDTFGHLYGATAADGFRPTFDHDVNVKTKRTIGARDNIICAIKNNTTNNMDITMVIRALVRKSN